MTSSYTHNFRLQTLKSLPLCRGPSSELLGCEADGGSAGEGVLRPPCFHIALGAAQGDSMAAKGPPK